MKCFTAVTLYRIFLFWLRFGLGLFCDQCLCVFQTFIFKIKGESSLPSWLVNCQMSQITYKCTVLLSWFFSRKCFHCNSFCFWLAVINMHTHYYHCYCFLPAKNITSIAVIFLQWRNESGFHYEFASVAPRVVRELMLSDITSSYFTRLKGLIQTHWN